MAALGRAAIAVSRDASARPGQYRFPFTPFPRGWFAVAFGDELVAGAVMPLQFFGKDLVAYRTESGRAVVADAHCPHLGAHLGYGGTVEGECIRCPFHRWKFDDSGRCVEIPFQNRPSSRARLHRWHVDEVDGMVLVWHDIDGSEPDWYVEPMAETDAFCLPQAPSTCDWTLRSHVQEICENAFDIAHFPAVHGMGLPPNAQLTFEGERSIVMFDTLSNGQAFGLPGEFPTKVRMDLQGLGVLQADTALPEFGFCFRNSLYMTPIDDQHIRLRAAMSVRKLGDDDTTAALQDIWVKTFAMDLPKDFQIWEHKVYVQRPEFSRVDGPIGRMRRWAQQFYELAAEPMVADNVLQMVSGAGMVK
ncbi:MAG TPA: Rieske 2Fe-2S domain-containing protein [Candidatus Binatia bacterium]|nr:Rieske 2Fe-2S domain-containing protein [Candidatus Binatia bacterium]